MTEALYYKTHVFLCTNRRPDGHALGCCASKGSEELRNYMKARGKELGLDEDAVRINGAGCLGRCDQGPAMVIYPEGIWYAPKTKEDVDEIIALHIQQGKRVARLLIAPPQS